MARRDHAAIDARGELQNTREQGLLPHRHGMGLDDAGARARLHQRGQAHHRVTRHHAVGVEHDHMVEPRTVGVEPVGNVAGLPSDIPAAPPPIQPLADAESLAQHFDARRFLGGDRIVGRVAQHEQLERIRLAGRLQRAPGRRQSVEHFVRGLVVDRYQDRGAFSQGRDAAVTGIVTRSPPPQRERMQTETLEQEARDRRPEGKRDPAEAQREHREQGDRQAIGNLRPQRGRQQLDAAGCRCCHQQQQKQSPPAGAPGMAVEVPERLGAGAFHGRALRGRVQVKDGSGW